ncbi:hypothetical protein [Streptomyces sp. VB1]|uniref:hypothetical protein n=1 Tax=Streptomyces sp. VB1 TaxID=2986803 RepID=UPI0022418E4A|nr:hypothetical protein [Streptomyces sp. VB1]UZI27162.1 hypothetical protein OH133_03000 [Streptomyces sp. VB1]
MLDVLLTVVGSLALVVAALSRWVQRAPLSAPLLALVTGIAFGPEVLGGRRPAHRARGARATARVLWFGPIGVSALFSLTLEAHRLGVDPTVLAAGALVVVAGTVVHGVTSAPGLALYRGLGERDARLALPVAPARPVSRSRARVRVRVPGRPPGVRGPRAGGCR